MLQRRVSICLSSIFLVGAIIGFFLQLTAHAITITPGSNLDIKVGKNSYTFENSSGSGVIYLRHELFNQAELIDGGYGQYSSRTSEGTHIQCSSQSSASIYIEATTATPNKNLREQLLAGETPDINLKLSIRRLDEGDDRACVKKLGELYSKPQSIKTQERQKAADTIIREETLSATEKKQGDEIFNTMSPLLGNFRDDSLSKDSRLAAGCATIGGSISCDNTAQQKLYKLTLGKCWGQAERVVANRTFGDTSDKAVRDVFSECLSKHSNASREDINNLAEKIDRNKMHELASQAGKETQDELNAQADKNEKAEETCGTRVSGVGWFMCGLLDMAVSLADGSWSLFEWLLATQPLKSTDENGAETAYYQTWSSVRNIANALLVVFFIFTIYSQLTGAGLTNYGIKKALPRIIIVAIAINLSFLIIQIAFDIANIIGSSLDKLIAGQVTIKPNLGNLITDIITSGALGTVGVAGVIGAASVVSGGAVVILAILIILPGIIAFIAGLVTLMVRAALLPVIAVFAPVAFVAYILPNTQPFFDKWKRSFTSMLFLYPMAAAYYGALKFTAFILIGSEDPSATLQRLMGYALLLFGSGVVLWLAIKSNAVTGKIAGGIQGALNKVASPVEKLGRATMAGMAMERMGAFRAQDFSKKSRFNPMRHIGRGMQAFDRSKRDRELRTALQNSEADQQWRQGLLNDPSRLRGLEGGAGGQGYLSKLEAEAVSNKEVSLRNQDLQALAKTLEEAIKSGDTITAKAAQNRLLNSGSAGLETFNGTIANADTSPGGISATMRESLSSNIRDNHASAMDKDMGTMKWATGDRTMVESQNDAAVELADKGIATEKFAQMTESAQKRLLESSHGGSILNQGQIAALTDQSGQYGGKIGKSVVEKLNKMKAQPIPAPSDPSDSYSI